jgi:hypothetical protein
MEKVTCFVCFQPIDVPPTLTRAAAVMQHYWQSHPERLVEQRDDDLEPIPS